MTDNQEDLLTDNVSEDKLDALRAKGVEYAALDAEINKLEETVKEKKRKLLNISMKEMPDLFDEAGADSIGLPDMGLDLKLKPYYHASIKEEDPNRQAAYDWLIANGHGELIKTVVSVQFSKDELEQAYWFLEVVNFFLKLQGLERVGSIKMGVLWQTLTAFVKEQVEAQVPLPLELLGATIGRVVKIVPRKK